MAGKSKLESAKEFVGQHKAATAGAVAGALVFGPAGAAAGAGIGEGLAKLRSGLKAAFEKPSEVDPQLAVKETKEPGFWGQIAEKLPKIAEITTGQRPVPESAPQALRQIRGEIAYAEIIIKINSLPVAERQKALNQLLESGRISSHQEAAAMYALLQQEIEYQQQVQGEQADKIQRLTPEIQAQEERIKDYRARPENAAVEAERSQREERVEVYDYLAANLEKAAKSKQGEPAVLRVLAEARGLAQRKDQGMKAHDLQMAYSEVESLHILLSASTPDQAAIEHDLPNFQQRLASRHQEARDNYERLQKENELVIGHLRQGEAKVDEAKVASEMPPEWQEAKKKSEQVKTALDSLSSGSQAETAVILVNRETAVKQTIDDYEAEYDRIGNRLGKNPSRAKIESEMDKDLLQNHKTAQKEATRIAGVRAGLAGDSNTEAIAYLKSLQKENQAELDKHQAQYEKLAAKYTSQKRLTEAEIVQKINGNYEKAYQEFQRTTQGLATIENWQNGQTAFPDFVVQLRAVTIGERNTLGGERDEAFAKRGTKQAQPDTIVLRYLDQVEAHVNGQKGKSLRQAVEADLNNISNSRDQEVQKIEELKSEPEKKLDGLKNEQAAAQERMAQSQNSQAATEVPYTDMIKYIEAKWGQGFLTAVNERMQQLTMVREDMVAINEAANQLKGESAEEKKNLAQGLAAKRHQELAALARGEEVDLHSFARELQASGVPIEDEDEAIETMKRVGKTSGGRSLFGIFAALLNSLNALQSQTA